MVNPGWQQRVVVQVRFIAEGTRLSRRKAERVIVCCSAATKFAQLQKAIIRSTPHPLTPS